MLTKRNKVERMTIVNTLLTSIYEELLKGEADDIDGLLQIAVYAQAEMNRIVFDLNQRKRVNTYNREKQNEKYCLAEQMDTVCYHRSREACELCRRAEEDRKRIMREISGRSE